MPWWRHETRKQRTHTLGVPFSCATSTTVGWEECLSLELTKQIVIASRDSIRLSFSWRVHRGGLRSRREWPCLSSFSELPQIMHVLTLLPHSFPWKPVTMVAPASVAMSSASSAIVKGSSWSDWLCEWLVSLALKESTPSQWHQISISIKMISKHSIGWEWLCSSVPEWDHN